MESTRALEKLVDRLARFDGNGTPVLSVYLDTRPDARGRDHFQPFLWRALREREDTFPAHSKEKRGFAADRGRIAAWIRDELEPQANGVALFACTSAGLFEAVQIEVPFAENRVHVDPLPHIYPLAQVLDRYPRYAVLVADTNLARIYVFALGARLQERKVENPKLSRTQVGGWSQMRYQRHVDDHYRRHAREVIAVLERTVREENVARVILAGHDVIVPLLREQLPPALAEKVVDVLPLDIRTPQREILAETLEVLTYRAALSVAGSVQHVLDEYRAGGLAVVGARAAERALAAGQVHELIVSADPAALRAERERPADVLERLVRLARQTDAGVTFVDDASLLAGVGGVGALLRYQVRGTDSAP